jgi:5,10-methylenetetrahydromethanopterin reductase
MRIGINGSNHLARPDVRQIVDDVAAAEDAGFTSYWIAQTGLVDALGLLALAGRASSTIELGTAVVPTWTRHPQVLAAQALTTQAAIDAPLVLGIGLAHQPMVEQRLGMRWEKPIRHVLDYLDILQPILETGAAAHHGEVWTFEGEAARPTDRVPSVMLAALGEQMLRIAGRRTDGTILWCVGPTTLERQIVPVINDAASAAGRPAPRTICSLPVWVTDDPARAREVVGRSLAIYATLPSYRAMLDIEGVHGLEDLTLVGSEDEVAEGIARVAAAGATDFTAVVMGADADQHARGRALLAAVR